MKSFAVIWCFFMAFTSPLLAVEETIDISTIIETPEEKGKSRAYHFGLGIAHLTDIGNDYNHYEKLFGDPTIYPEFWGEYSVLDLGWGFDVALGLRLGFYRDSGKSVRRTEGLEVGEDGLNRDITDEEVDRSQKSILTLVPVQGVVSIGFAPFASRWLVANVWSGIGLTYVENSTKANLDGNVNQSGVKPYLNAGWNRERLVGASFSIDISQLSAWDAYSLDVHGVEAIYLTPYLQMVTTTKNKVGIYNRKMVGIMFTFETRR